MALLSIIRRWHLRDQISLREIARRLGVSRNTVRKYLRTDTTEPNYSTRRTPSALDSYAFKLSVWLKTEANKPRKQRRTLKQMHADLCLLGFNGSYDRVAAFARQWKVDQLDRVKAASKGTGQRLKAVALPDESCFGEPFWVLMALQDGELTGSFFCAQQEGRNFIPLFFSKYHAELAFQEKGFSPEAWCVGGLPRYALRAFILMMELFQGRGIEPMIMFRTPGETGDELGYAGFVTNAELLKREYYCGDI